MIVTVVRHGEAADAADDQLRPLTQRGESEVALGCERLAAACAAMAMDTPDTILHSPWVRTTSTAAIAAAAFPAAALAPDEALRPGSMVNGVLVVLEGLFKGPGCAHLLLVSHQPLVGYMLDYFLGERGAVPSLSPGAMATLDMASPVRGGSGVKFWLLPPEYEVGR